MNYLAFYGVISREKVPHESRWKDRRKKIKRSENERKEDRKKENKRKIQRNQEENRA